MLKRKYGDRRGWKRVITKKFAQSFVEDEDFYGYITLLNIIQTTSPLTVKYGEKEICIVNNEYMWSQQFPSNEKHSVTTVFNSRGELVQWYIDICNKIVLENGVPWMDDLYLDIVILPSGEIIELDKDELEEALLNGYITKQQFDFAQEEATRIVTLINKGEFKLLTLVEKHKKILEEKLS